MPTVGALPVVPGATCPSVAGAMGAAGLGPVCQVANGASTVVGSAASHLAGFGVDSVLNALGSWVSDGAVWLLARIGSVLGTTTSIDLGASWFAVHYQTMAALAGVVIVPLALLGIVQSVYRQDASMLVRSVVVHVPLALLLTAMAVKLVQLGLALTDAMSAAVAQGAGLDTGHFLSTVAVGLTATPGTSQAGTPAFVLFLGGVAVVFGAVMVWVELVIRAAAVYVAVLFLPLALASLAWPSIAHWCRRLVDTLVALILGKFVIVSVLSLAAGALAGGTGSTPSGATGSGGGGGFADVVGGAALLLLSAFAPWALFRLLPFLEAGTVAHLEGLGARAKQNVTAPARGLAQIAMRSAVAGSAAGGVFGAIGALGGAGGSGPHSGAPNGLPGPGGGNGGGAAGPAPGSGPSSAESTGVGTMEAPGHGIPMWEPNPASTAAARNILGGGSQRAPGPTPLPPTPPAPAIAASSDALVPLPKQTGVDRLDALGRDELGIRLVSLPAPSGGTDPDGASGAGVDRGS